MKIKPIEWSGEIDSNKECGYTHAIGTTPLGRFLITWKGWKEVDYKGIGIDENPIGHSDINSDDVEHRYAQISLDSGGNNDLDFTKLICQGEYERVVSSCVDTGSEDHDEVLHSGKGMSILRIDELEKRIDKLESQRVEGIGSVDKKLLRQRVDNWVKEEVGKIHATESIAGRFSDGIMRLILEHHEYENE